MQDQIPETILGLSLASFFSIVFFIVIITIVAKWKIYVKAGQAGWASIIPIYNIYILLKIVGKPGWWLLVMIFFPPVGLFLAIWMINLLSKSFGRGIICTLGLLFLSPLFYLMLGFGDAKYIGPGGE